MLDYLTLIDTQTGGPRCDITPLFANPVAFQQLIADLSRPFTTLPFEYVAGIDALGFILGTAIALTLHKGFIPIRKGGKLPGPKHQARCIDYTNQEKVVELRAYAFAPGSRFVVVDEWIETGAQMEAAIHLIEQQGGIVIGITTINMDDHARTIKLRERYFCHMLWRNMAV